MKIEYICREHEYLKGASNLLSVHSEHSLYEYNHLSSIPENLLNPFVLRIIKMKKYAFCASLAVKQMKSLQENLQAQIQHFQPQQNDYDLTPVVIDSYQPDASEWEDDFVPTDLF